jgi:putative aldouronate transport system permease protein
MLTRIELFKSLLISVERVVLAVIISTVVTVLMAYPLSKPSSVYPTRKYYVGLLVFCMIFNGGLVPGIILVKVWLNLSNTIWALVLPMAVPIFNVILVMNSFRQLPKEVEEAAMVDGASNIRILFQVIVPMSKPVIATVIMFVFVNHWNEWFNGLIFMDKVELYPFQTYLQTTIKAPDIKSMMDLQNYALVSDKTIKCAQVIIGFVPMMIAFPLVQKYFAQGITLGAVKG